MAIHTSQAPLPGTAAPAAAAPHSRHDRLGLPVVFGRPLRQLAVLTSGVDFVPRAGGLRRVHRGGENPLRILLFGGGSAVGLGVRTHDLGISGGMADAVSTWTGRGVLIDVVISAELTSRRAIADLRRARTGRYDAIVVALGPLPAWELRSPAQWRAEFTRLTDVLLAETSEHIPIAVVNWEWLSAVPGLGQLNGAIWRRSGDRLSDVVAEICSRHPRIRYLQQGIDAAGADVRIGHGAASIYARHGAEVGKHLALRLIQTEGLAALSAAEHAPADPDPEAERQAAVDASTLRDAVGDHRLSHLVRMARLQYGTTYAQLNLIDGDVQRIIASATEEQTVGPREDSICHTTIQRRNATLISDATADPRVPRPVLTPAGAPIRFYAGVPIESPNGYRIGVLCVFDSERRLPTDVDPTALTTLAADVERRVWELMLENDGVEPDQIGRVRRRQRRPLPA